MSLFTQKFHYHSMYICPGTALIPVVPHAADLLSVSQPCSLFWIWISAWPQGGESFQTPYCSFLRSPSYYTCIPKLLHVSQVHQADLSTHILPEVWIRNFFRDGLSGLHALFFSHIPVGPDSFPKLPFHLFSKNGKGEKKKVKGATQDPVFSFLSAPVSVWHLASDHAAGSCIS